MAHPDDMACYLGCEVVKETLHLESRKTGPASLSRENGRFQAAHVFT